MAMGARRWTAARTIFEASGSPYRVQDEDPGYLRSEGVDTWLEDP